MSKANKFLTEEDAVSPVIGVILMVAITVILAAVIAAFVFGMGPPEQAPVASIRLTGVSGSNVTLQHQGGDSIDMSDTTITVSQGTNVSKYTKMNKTAGKAMFEGGDILVLYAADDTNNAVKLNGVEISPTRDGVALTVVSPSSEDVKVTIVDTVSGQMIADMKYNV